MSTKEMVYLQLKEIEEGKVCPKCGSSNVVGRTHVINRKNEEQLRMKYKHCKVCHWEWNEEVVRE